MPNKMLIDATHPEETRVVVVRGHRVEEFDFESAQRKQLRGNIYLAKVTRVEPSLQAAFIEYGGNRHGFLAFSEIHPDYYQIPVADRQALIEADERAHREAEEESERRPSRRRSRHRNARRRGHGDRVQSEVIAEDAREEGADAVLLAESGELVETPSQTPDAETAPAELTESAEAGSHDHHPDEVSEPAADVAAAPAPLSATASVALPSPPDIAALPAPETAEAFAADDAALPAQDMSAPETASEGDADAEVPRDDEHDHHDDAPVSAADIHADEHEADEDEDDDDEEDAEHDLVESVGGDDVLEEVPERAFRPRRQYKIQEVIKRRQVMLVQVVKEERGNKGAALTTYLSLAGRYAVLMPNTARGGGISRKITSAQDRARLKDVVQDLDVPEGMGVILRTAGASRTKPEIKRDFEYLLRLWETVRDTTLKSQAPTLVYEEGSLIKRSLRDLYNKEIDEIQVAGDAGYHEARDFMKMLMPSNVKAVKQYRDPQPLFSRMGVESQLDAMFSPTVQLRSGGYIVINQTEALVSIDVNSGRSTREHHIEDTALKTNLEAAEEVARQLRLRDLAGLIVIDFIDMDEKRNNRAVERKLAECLRQDRARIQVGRISHFGLLEMSRQRIRASVLESSTEPCAHCGGTGHVRSVASVALQLLRGVEEILMKGATHNLVVRTRTDVALYVLNHKRSHLRDLEDGFEVTISIIADESVAGLHSYLIDRGEQVHTLEAAKAILAAQAAATPAVEDDEDVPFEVEAEIETEETEGLGDETPAEASDGDGDGDGRRKRRRRRRRGRGGEAREGAAVTADDDEAGASLAPEDTVAAEDDSAEGTDDAEETENAADQGERRRRRGRRGGRRRRGNGADDQRETGQSETEHGEDGLVGALADELSPPPESEVTDQVADLDHPAETPPVDADSIPHVPAEPAQPRAAAAASADAPGEEHGDDKAARRRSTVREKVSFLSATPPAAAAEPAAPMPTDEPATPSLSVTEPQAAAEPAAETADPPRRGWWSRRFGSSS